jgi:hypothetical protein
MRLRYSMGVNMGTAIPIFFLMVFGVVLALLAAVVIFFLTTSNDVGGTLTHEEYMRLSSQEAHGLRLCQRTEIFNQMEKRYGSGRGGGRKAWKEYRKLMKAQRREGQPTMPKFVDPGDPPSFQETMWKKGYKCQGVNWQEFVADSE